VRGNYHPPDYSWLNHFEFHSNAFTSIYQRDVQAVFNPSLPVAQRVAAGLDAVAAYIPALLETLGTGIANTPVAIVKSGPEVFDSVAYWDFGAPIGTQARNGLVVAMAAAPIVLGIIGLECVAPAVELTSAAEGGGLLTEAGAQEIGILRDAAKGSGNFGLGAADSATATRLGEAWVGDGATLANDGKTLVSADGLRQFRPPSFKPFRGTFQANLEQRFAPQGPWNSNGHLDILFGPPEAP
jgi:hypothetical protein